MVFLSSFISSFLLVSFSWSLAYFCLYERQSELGKWNGLLWYLVLLFCFIFADIFNYTFYFGILIIILTILFTPLEKFPNGYHYVTKEF